MLHLFSPHPRNGACAPGAWARPQVPIDICGALMPRDLCRPTGNTVLFSADITFCDTVTVTCVCCVSVRIFCESPRKLYRSGSIQLRISRQWWSHRSFVVDSFSSPPLPHTSLNTHTTNNHTYTTDSRWWCRSHSVLYVCYCKSRAQLRRIVVL